MTKGELGLESDIRNYATINELICLSNVESLNVVFIEQGILNYHKTKTLSLFSEKLLPSTFFLWLHSF